MEKWTFKNVLILLLHALAVWAFCGAVMGIGMTITTLENALIIHAISAPIITFAISSLYYWKFNYTTPLQTATAFILVVIFMDLFVVAMLINKNFDMFKSFIGTWLPFILIFLATYISGKLWEKIRT